MFIARIDGTLTATAKHASLKGVRLLLAQRLDAQGRALGDPQVVLDALGAGLGSFVLVSTDGEHVRASLGDRRVPARLMTVGLVDAIEVRP